MRNIRMALFCAGTNFRKWSKNPTIIVLGLVWFVYNMNFSHGIAEMCQDNGYRISPWILPFYINNYYTIFMFVIALTILFSQAPFCDTTTPFTLVRTGKFSWFLGQILYIVGASFAFVAVTYGFLLLFISPGLGFSITWGGVLEGLAEDGSLLRRYNEYISVSGSLIREYGAIEATAITFGLMWITAILVGMILLFFNTFFKRGAGLVVTGAVAAWSWFSEFGLFVYGTWIRKTCLFHWCSLQTMYPLDVYGVRISTAVITQLVLITVLIVASSMTFCKRDTVFEKSLF